MGKVIFWPLKVLGYVLLSSGILVWVVTGLWGFFIELAIVNEAAGFWGVVIGIMILPVTFFAAPFYALVAYDTWFPLILIYGGGFVGICLYGSGALIKEKLEELELESEELKAAEPQRPFLKIFIEWLRWLLVLPAAIAGYFAIQAAVGIVSLLLYLILPVLGNDMVCQFINSILGPVCFVLAGAKTAPQYSFIVAICLTVVYATFSITLISIGTITGVSTTNPLWWLILTSLIGIIAAIVTSLFLRNRS